MCIHVHVCAVCDTISHSMLTVGHNNTPRCICMLCMTLFCIQIAFSGL